MRKRARVGLAMTEFKSPLDAGAVAALRSRYGFTNGFPLDERLDEALGMYAAAGIAPPATARSRRERCDVILRASHAALSDPKRHSVLARLLFTNPSILPQLPARLERHFDGDGNMVDGPSLRFTATELRGIVSDAERAKPLLARKQKPVPGDRAVRILVADLAAIWTEGTGKRASFTRPVTGDSARPEGPFLDFLAEVTALIGIRSSKTALARVWERARRRAR